MKKKKRDFNLNNFVYGNFKLSLKYLKTIKFYFIFSLMVFLALILIGVFFPIFFEERIMELIESLIIKTQDLNLWELIRFIVYNNIQSAFLSLLFGIFLGIVPVAIIVINGYVLGFVINKIVAMEGHFVLWRLLPHGIFEIPAILISVSLGIRLGMFLFVYKGKNKRKEFWKWIKDALRVFILVIIPLLVIAGIIEGFLIWVLG